jgi:YD repeat-containing protein
VVHKGQTNEATYKLTLDQLVDANGRVTQSTWAFTCPPFLSQTVVTQIATYNNDGSFNTPYKVIDDTTQDGAALPEVTSTYWDNEANPEKIDQVVENGGADGVRTTTYTYAWLNDANGVPQIDHLSQIQQSGGSNPYTANYDDAGQLTSYSDTWGSETVTYSENTVTTTQKINGQPVRTLVTTYSGDMSKATTTAQ